MIPVSSATGMKSRRRHQCPVVALPAHEGLETAHLPGHDVDDRLVVEPHLLSADRAVEGVFDVHPSRQVGLHRVVEQRHSVAAVGLGAMGGDVGTTHQFFGRQGAIAGRDGDADAGGDEHRRISDRDRLAERLSYLLDPHHRVGGRGGGAVDDDEVVASRAGDGAAEAADQQTESIGDHDEHAVGVEVAETVVDVLEAIEVELDDGRLLFRPPGGLQAGGPPFPRTGCGSVVPSGRRG